MGHSFAVYRRPDKAAFAGLILEAAGLPCIMPEQTAMTRILEYFERWQVRPATLSSNVLSFESWCNLEAGD